MNNDRRKEIKEVIKNLGVRPMTNDILETAVNDIESIKADEQEAFDNLSEGLQSGRQDSHDEIIEALEDAVDFIESMDADDDEASACEEAVQSCIDKLQEIN